MQHSVWFKIAFALIAFTYIQGAPTPNNDDLQSKFNSLQEQLSAIQSLLNKRGVEQASPVQNGSPTEVLERKARYMSFQPMKRMVSWQPMKRNADYTKEQVIRAIEEQLSEILRAGETLGVNADEVLQHLRQRNAGLA
ncbi:hypothetical protein M3Y97_00342200 [Aphelenchoides bicaudatus]|nr:hypothetical protein M3Y97_00342200 [Aphelenchoides bicaudatus]